MYQRTASYEFKTNPMYYPDTFFPSHAVDTPAWSYNKAEIPESMRFQDPAPRF